MPIGIWPAPPLPAVSAAAGNALSGKAAPPASLARSRCSDGIGAQGGSFALVVPIDSWLADEAGSTGAASSSGGAASPGEPGPAAEPKLAGASGPLGGVGAAANPDDADPAKPKDADPADPDIADPVKPEDADPADPDIADPVKPDDPVKPGEDGPPKPEDPVKPVDADPPKVGEADPGMAGLRGAGMNPAGWSSGAASASASGAWLPTTAGARGAVGAPFLIGPFLALLFLAGPFLALPFLAATGLRFGTWVAARTSASRADRACRRRHARTAKINPSRSRKTTPAMAASMTSLPLMFRWIGVLGPAGVEGGDGAAPEAAVLDTASWMAAALVSALAASTLPEPEPSRRPPRPYTVLAVSARVTWAGVRSGNCARMSATMPATIALAALVLLNWV